MKNYLLALTGISAMALSTGISTINHNDIKGQTEIAINDIKDNLSYNVAPLKTNVTDNIGKVFKLVDNWKQYALTWTLFTAKYKHFTFDQSKDVNMTTSAFGYKPYQSYGEPKLAIDNINNAMNFDTTKIVNQQPAFDSSGFNYWDVAPKAAWNIYFLSSNSYSRWVPHLYEISFHSWFAFWHTDKDIYGEIVTNFQVDTHAWLLPVHFNTALNLKGMKLTK